MPRTLAGRIMVGGRMLFGTAFFAAPGPSMQAVGLRPASAAAHWGRVFGLRDTALGVGLLASSGDARKLWWRIGIACDLGDAVAGTWSWSRGDLPRRPRTLVMFTGSALAGAALGAVALASGDV